MKITQCKCRGTHCVPVRSGEKSNFCEDCVALGCDEGVCFLAMLNEFLDAGFAAAHNKVESLYAAAEAALYVEESHHVPDARAFYDAVIAAAEIEHDAARDAAETAAYRLTAAALDVHRAARDRVWS